MPAFLLICFATCLAVLALLCGITVGESASSLARPRLLLGKDDPFTGLTILRARYAAGMRPSDDIAGQALTYLVTGQESFAKRALDEMRRTHPPQQVGSRTYMDYVRWSLAFDWLYGCKEFDGALKDRVAGELLNAAERMFQDHALAEPSLVMYHNYSVRFLTLATFALTAIEGHPSTEQRSLALRERARLSLDNVLDISQFITPEGGYHESMDYQRITFLPMALLAELRRTTSGDDPARRFTAYQHYGDTYLYKILPDGTSSRRGDHEWPYLLEQDNDVLGYIVNRFKDPYAAWMLRKSGWPSSPKWYIPILQFLWDDPLVQPRDPALASEVELPRQHLFSGVGDLVMRNGWGKDSTWIEFTAGGYFAKHQHLDQNQFTIFHDGYLAIDSAADYTETESPNYLNYYRRTIAHNTMLIYKPGEPFFWAENLWPAANDGGQRMDSSRYWNTIRSVEDWERTRDLWDIARMEVTDYVPNELQYARGDASNAYSSSKVEVFTRDLLYLPPANVLLVFDHVRSKDPSYRKVWLLHGVNEPTVEQQEGRADGHGGTAYAHAENFAFEDGGGRLLVHTLLPKERQTVKRGGPEWEFWTPGDEFGGAWGSGKNWPIEDAQGGPLPSDPYLKKMWLTFWGDDLQKISPSNMLHVVPGSWRVEISPEKPSKDDLFLNVLEIGNKGDPKNRRVVLADGSNLMGAAIAGQALALFAAAEVPVTDGEVTVPDIDCETLIATGLKPESKYELELTGGKTKTWGGGLFQGVHLWGTTADTDRAGVLRISFHGHKDARLRLHLIQ